MRLRFPFVALLLLVLPACSDEITLDVRVCGDLEVPTDLDSLVFAVEDDMLAEVSNERLLLADEGPLGLSVELTTVEPSGYVSVASGLGNRPVGRSTRHLTSFENAGRIDLVLSRACYGAVSCSDGQTCNAGACVIAPENDEAPRCPD